jgi:branched-chain amino acid transport system ATP-binding protein
LAENKTLELLSVKEIKVKYGDVEVLKGISLYLLEGEIATLLGANGAGKTTTLNTICGINSLISGEILFQGRNINGVTPDKIVRLGIAQVPEGRRVFPGLTVLENLDLGAYLRKDKKQIEYDLVEVFELFPRLKERFQQSAGTLSGGEQQMLAVGRALMSHPKLLLLDEPTMGLSPLMSQAVSEIIWKINRRGVSILLVEQNARMALRLASSGFIMETGRIVLKGSGQELTENELVKKAYLGG